MSSHPTLNRRLILTFVLAALAIACPAFAAKEDLVVLRNGDKITGEVKWLTRGKLEYNTDDAGRLQIEWVKIAQLRSPHSFEVETGAGFKYYGRLVASEEAGKLVVGGVELDTLSIPDVVAINALDAGFLKRVRAFLDLGLTFAKANQATTFNTDGEAAYRGNRYGSTFSFSSYAQGDESSPTTSRNSVGLRVIRFLPKRWSALALGQTEQNDELNLELRVTGAAALGRVLKRSNTSELGLGGGLAVTGERFSAHSENPAAGETTNTSLEGLLYAAWDAFRFDSPKLDFATSLSLFPGLSEAGRLRGEATVRLKYEIISDFDVGVSATDTFDSDPPDEDATKNDFITTFTIGWSYRR